MLQVVHHDLLIVDKQVDVLLALDNNSSLLAPDYQRLQRIRELLRNVLNENRAVGPHVGVSLHRVQGGNVLERQSAALSTEAI